MRIAVLLWTRRRIAGTEAYVAAILRGLAEAGHQVALVSETDAGTGPPLAAPGIPEWCAADLSLPRLEQELRKWRADLLYAHLFLDTEFERRMLGLAPAVFFAHNFSGTCISGHKSFAFPRHRLCNRTLGLGCLLHYYPHRCGGLSPITMLRNYAEQRARLALLRRYAAIVTHSRWMEAECLRHGLARERVHRITYCVTDGPIVASADLEWRRDSVAQRPHLVFIGRMTPLKGGQVLIRALPAILKGLDRPIRVTFAGDGPARADWERKVRRASVGGRGCEVEFSGWLDAEERQKLLDEADLLVVPSVWPEPFGIVGMEAARRGVPAAGFAAGGIPDWLTDGVNGFLAPADPPTAEGLAEAVVRCLADPELHGRLRLGALDQAERFTLSNHMMQLEPILATAARPAAVHE